MLVKKIMNAALESVKTLVELTFGARFESIFCFVISCRDDIGATR
jgi:hypothetical protein